MDRKVGRHPKYDIAPAVEKVVAASNPEFLRKMALAMVQSAIHATERIGSLTDIPEDEIRISTGSRGRGCAASSTFLRPSS